MYQVYKPHMKKLSLAIVFKSLEATGDLMLPFLMAKIIDNGIKGGNLDYTIKMGMLMILSVTLGWICSIICNYFSVSGAEALGSDLRTKLFYKATKFDFVKLNKFTQSSIITRITKDISQITMMTLMCTRMVIRGLITGVGAIIMAFIIAPSLATIVMIVVAISIYFIYFYMEKSIAIYDNLQKKVDSLTRVLRENLTGIRVIKALVREDYEQKRFFNINDELTEESIYAANIMASRMPFISLLLNSGIVLVLYFGTSKIRNSTLEIGELVAFVNYFNMLLFTMMALSFLFTLWSKTIISYRRVKEILDEEINDEFFKDNRELGVLLPKADDNIIEFRDVYFAYDGNTNYALEDINLTIKRGESVGIVGGVGSGKTTLANLIVKFYKATKGKVFVEGVDVSDWNDDALRSLVGIVMQKSFLFSESIEDNIKWGKLEARDLEVESALDTAQISDYVETLPEKKKSVVSKGGVNFSGGQKQRLSIARTIIKDATVQIFDDSFSALDFITEAQLKKELFATGENITRIIISQRISTIKNLDKIVVLDSGKLAGVGSHKELLKSSLVYQEICKSQLVSLEGEKDEK